MRQRRPRCEPSHFDSCLERSLAPLRLHSHPQVCYDQAMRNIRRLAAVLLSGILALSVSRGLSQEVSTATPIIHVSFDQLVPSSYPVIHPRFDRLRSTTYPIIHPGIPQVHISDNLVRPTSQPLLLTYPILPAPAPTTRQLSPRNTHSRFQSRIGPRPDYFTPTRP